jgi:hypothetical protein
MMLILQKFVVSENTTKKKILFQIKFETEFFGELKNLLADQHRRDCDHTVRSLKKLVEI